MTHGGYRVGPWPGLTPRGAAALLLAALAMGVAQLLIGPVDGPWPDLAVLGATAFAPLVVATRLTGVPGAAAAVSGAYLLPRTLVSLLEPSIAPPPLLLVPALAYDVSAWLRASDLAGVASVWPGRANPWRRKRVRQPRRVGTARAAIAGAIFGLVLAAVQPPFAILLGGDPAAWAGVDLWLGSGACVAACAVLGLIARGTES